MIVLTHQHTVYFIYMVHDTHLLLSCNTPSAPVNLADVEHGSGEKSALTSKSFVDLYI